MNEKHIPEPLEIDFFDFIEIILKRKYLIISAFIISVLLSTIYCYFLQPNKPKQYSIYMILNVNIDADDKFWNAFVNDVRNWHRSGVYKGVLQKKFPSYRIAEITMENIGNSLLQYKLTYNDLEKGKEILNQLKDVMENSESCKQSISREFTKMRDHIKILEVDVELLSTEINTEKKKVSYLERLKEEIINQTNKIKLDIVDWDQLNNEDYSGLKQIERVRTIIDNFQKMKTLLSSESEKFILVLDNNIPLANKFIARLERELTEKQIALDGLVKKKTDLKTIFDFEGPIYATEIPTQKTPNINIIAITGMFGGLIGILIGFFIEIRNKRNNRQ